MEEKKKLIEDLLLDIDILNKLDKWTSDINIFEVSGMKHQEIRHSNTLAWFFDTNESHNLNDQFIRRFMQKVITFNVDVNKDINIFDASLIDYGTFRINREWRNIDIVIESPKEKMVFVIENKVYDGERKGQLKKYFDLVNKEFPDYKKVFIFLTGEGDEPSDSENWCTASYNMIIDSLNESLNSTATISEKTKMIIEDYISLVRRVFGMDKELKEVINEIYYKHKRAFDLILEVATNSHAQVSDYIKEWIIAHKDIYGINLTEDSTTITYVRFTSDFIDELFPYDETKSDSWNSGHSHFYEIHVMRDKGAYFFATLGNSNRTHTETLINFIKWDRKPFKFKRTLKARHVVGEEIQEGLTEEVMEIIDSNLHKIMKTHVLPFEEKLRKFIEEDNKK